MAERRRSVGVRCYYRKWICPKSKQEQQTEGLGGNDEKRCKWMKVWVMFCTTSSLLLNFQLELCIPESAVCCTEKRIYNFTMKINGKLEFTWLSFCIPNHRNSSILLSNANWRGSSLLKKEVAKLNVLVWLNPSKVQIKMLGIFCLNP